MLQKKDRLTVECDRKKLANPVALVVEQAFGLKFVATESRPRLNGVRVVNYKYHFEFPDDFPAGAWTTLLSDINVDALDPT